LADTKTLHIVVLQRNEQILQARRPWYFPVSSVYNSWESEEVKNMILLQYPLITYY